MEQVDPTRKESRKRKDREDLALFLMSQETSEANESAPSNEKCMDWHNWRCNLLVTSMSFSNQAGLVSNPFPP